MKRAFLSAVFLAAGLAVMADKLIMKDGRVFEGKIVEETDTTVKIKMAKGTIPFPKDQIEKIERGTSSVDVLEEKLEALSPSNPAAYVDLAQWCVEQKMGDDPLIIRLANIGMGLDGSLCGRGNALLGDIAAAKSDRGEAAECYRQAFMADWKNPEIRRKFLEYRGGLEEQSKRQMGKLRDALSTAIDGKLEDALPGLIAGRNAPCANQVTTFMSVYSSYQAFLSDMQARVPCKTCAGTGSTKCSQCDGGAVFTCTVCGGKKVREVKGGGKVIRTEKCGTCDGKGRINCPKCGATGKVKCGTCKGVIPPRPMGSLNKRGLMDFRAAIEQRMSGSLPIEEQIGPKLPRLGTAVFDSSFVDEGKIVYRKGKWVTREEK